MRSAATRRSLHRHAMRFDATPTPTIPPAASSAPAGGSRDFTAELASAAAARALADKALATPEVPQFTVAHAKARHQRRMRLWLVGAVMGAAAVATVYRSSEQIPQQEQAVKQREEQRDAARHTLQLAQAKDAERRERILRTIASAAPTTAALLAASAPAAVTPVHAAVAGSAAFAAASSSSDASATPAITAAPIVPTRFLDAAVLDVARTLRVARVDERVLLAPSAQALEQVMRKQQESSKPQKPRSVMIM